MHMPDTPEDPVDHARTARRFTGEAMKNTRTTPGLALAGVALSAFVVGVYLLAVGHATDAVLVVATATALGTIGVNWVLAEHRRVVRHELRWLAEHPGVPPEPPTG